MPKPIQVMESKASPWGTRLLAPLTLFEWGAILIYFYSSHRLTAFLHPSFHVLVLITGLLLLASSACVFWWNDETDPQPVHECGDAHCAHSHPPGMSAGRFLIFLVLSLPVALAAMISPDSYGSGMVRNRGALETAAPSVAPELPKEGAIPLGVSQTGEPIAVEVGDLLIAAKSESGMAHYNGKRVEFTGQVFPLGERKIEIVRMLMLCCAADVQMLAVRVVSDHDLDIPAMKWVKVTGRVAFSKRGGQGSPVVTAEKVLPVPKPADPYVYHGGTLPATKPHGDFNLQIPPR